MELRRRYYILDLFAKAMTVGWLPFILFMMVLGLIVGWVGGTFILGFLYMFIFGFFIALPMVLFGQFAGAFLDQAELLTEGKLSEPEVHPLL